MSPEALAKINEYMSTRDAREAASAGHNAVMDALRARDHRKSLTLIMIARMLVETALNNQPDNGITYADVMELLSRMQVQHAR